MSWYNKRKPYRLYYSYYAVTRGHQIGIFEDYEQMKEAVKKFSAFGNMKGFHKKVEAEKWLAEKLPRLDDLRFPQSDDTNLGFVGTVERVASKIGIVDGRLFMKVHVGDDSGQIEDVSLTHEVFQFIYDMSIDKEDLKKDGKKIKAQLMPKDNLAKERLRRFRGFIWLRNNPFGQFLTPKRPEIELVKLVPFQSSEDALKKLSEEFQQESRRTVTANEEDDLSQAGLLSIIINCFWVI